MKRTLVVASVLAVSGFAPLAQATDFTLVVPVNISNLPPEISRVTACCYISTRAAGGTIISDRPCVSGAVSGGAVNTEFTIALNALPGVDPATGTAYACYVEFDATVRGAAVRVGTMSAGAIRLPLTSGSLLVNGAVTR